MDLQEDKSIRTNIFGLVYGIIKAVVGLRLSEEQEFQGADLSIHRIAASPDYDRVVSE